jgi:hypothetical protein
MRQLAGLVGLQTCLVISVCVVLKLKGLTLQRPLAISHLVLASPSLLCKTRVLFFDPIHMFPSSYLIIQKWKYNCNIWKYH